MSKILYDHLIILEEIETLISEYRFEGKEKQEISQMIEETIHYRVLNVILINLPKEHHQTFLERFHQAPYDEDLLNFLKEKVANIEDLISDEIKILEKELKKDLMK